MSLVSFHFLKNLNFSGTTKYKGKPRRWVVERTNSWHNRFRAILIRWERKSENYLASLYLASTIIVFNFFNR
ncbi:transposase DDE domain protein [Leptospira kirschneri str. H2]|nr:transposase DDE domain protein [Leptospira kirschneri str. H2]